MYKYHITIILRLEIIRYYITSMNREWSSHKTRYTEQYKKLILLNLVLLYSKIHLFHNNVSHHVQQCQINTLYYNLIKMQSH